MPFEFASPAVLLLLIPLVPLLAWRLWRRPTTPALLFPTVANVRQARKTMRQRMLDVLPFLQIIAVCLLVVAAARPRRGDEHSIIRREGIAIQMVLDVSGSMEEPMRYRDADRPKIEIVKEIFTDFVDGTDDATLVGGPAQVEDARGVVHDDVVDESPGAALGHHRDPRPPQHLHVAVDGAPGHLQPLGQFTRRQAATNLKQKHDGKQSTRTHV